MSRLRITLLGAFQATLDGESLTAFGTDKARALLAYLAVESHRPHRREHLAGMLWSNQTEKKALHNLRQSLSTLRKVIKDQKSIPPYLLVDRDSIQFNPKSSYWLDTSDFISSLSQGLPQNLQGQTQRRSNIRRLKHAVSLYQGNFLDQMILRGSPLFDEWAILQREMLTRRAIEAMCLLIDYHERRSEFEQASKIAEQIVALIPWEENGHRIVMRILAQARQWSAIEVQYQSIVRYLVEDLGVEPSDETTALMENIRAHAKEDLALPPRLTSYPANLPLETTPFVGRETELKELSDLIAKPDCRVITLTGPGGIGKSRLALEMAREQTGLFEDGVFFVPLSSVNNIDFVTTSIAEAIGFSFYTSNSPMTLLTDYLRQKKLLLVLDNFEQLLTNADLALNLITNISASAPGVVILITSRQPLNLRIEQVIEVSGLAYTVGDNRNISDAFERDEHISALQLFNQVALRVNPKFSLESYQEQVIRICQLVEGLPLGIELSATWIRWYSPHEIASQIEKDLDFLATSMRDIPHRHQSLRTVFNHSWHLLSEDEKVIFQQLTVFQGSIWRGAAVEITGATPDQIITFVEQSLLHQTADERYIIHNLLHQYASEKLSLRPEINRATRDSHCNYFANLIKSHETALHSSNPVQAQNILSAEIENIRSSWRWASKQKNISAIAQAARGLGRFFDMNSWFTEGRDAFSSTAKAIQDLSLQNDVNLKVWAIITTQTGWFEVQLGNYQAAVTLLEDLLPKLEKKNLCLESSSAYNVLGSAVYELGELDKAKSYFSEGLSLANKVKERSQSAMALNYLGNIARIQGEFTKACQRYEDSLAEYQQLGDKWGSAKVLNNLGSMVAISGDYKEAEQYFRDSLSIRRKLEDQAGIAGCLHNLSNIAYIAKDFQKTKQLRLECLEICQDIGFTWGLTSTLKHLGDVEKALKNLPQARKYYLESLEISKISKNRRSTAFTLSSLGNLAVLQIKFREAKQYYANALIIANELELTPLIIDIIIGVAEIWMHEEDYEKAYHLLKHSLYQPGAEQQTLDKGNQLKSQIESHLPISSQEKGEYNQKPKSLKTITTELLDVLSFGP
jgi:predicted ATPase/DNA-binding SARP family transcriptional activator/uncharacterized protein HemY